MDSAPFAGTVHPEPQSLPPDELRERYRAYRTRQASRLLSLLPKESIRPLYRRALRSLPAHGSDDPLRLLVEFCERLMPLPPMHVWAADLQANPEAHLEELGDAAATPTSRAPATLAYRWFQVGTRSWSAHLRGFGDEGVWRGFLAFHDPASGARFSTASVFRADDPVELVTRFEEFDGAALSAFLRSALP